MHVDIMDKDAGVYLLVGLRYTDSLSLNFGNRSRLNTLELDRTHPAKEFLHALKTLVGPTLRAIVWSDAVIHTNGDKLAKRMRAHGIEVFETSKLLNTNSNNVIKTYMCAIDNT